MKLEQKAFREVTENAGFDINAGQNIDMSKSFKLTIYGFSNKINRFEVKR